METKTRWETHQGNIPPCLISKGLHASPAQLCWLQHTFFCWAASTTCVSPWQISHTSDTSNILESPKQSKLHWQLYKMVSQDLYTGDSHLHTHIHTLSLSLLVSAILLNLRGRLYSPLCIFCDSKARTMWIVLPQSAARLGWILVLWLVFVDFLFSCFLGAEIFWDLFTSLKFSWLWSCLPLFQCRSSLSFSLRAQALVPTLNFLVFIFSSNCIFCRGILIQWHAPITNV